MIGERGSPCISALRSNNGTNVAHFRKQQQNAVRERVAECAFVLVDKPSNTIGNR